MFRFTDTNEPIKIGDIIYFIDKEPVYSNGVRKYKTAIKSDLVKTLTNNYINHEMPNGVFTKWDTLCSTEEACQQQIDFEESNVFIRSFLSKISTYNKSDTIKLATALKEYSKLNIIDITFIYNLLPAVDNKIIEDVRKQLIEDCQKCDCTETVDKIDEIQGYIEYLSLKDLFRLKTYLDEHSYLDLTKKLKRVVARFYPLLDSFRPF